VTTIQFRDGVSSDAPFLNGHFPASPIVPGAVLLGYASNELQDRGYEIESILRMKFLRPLLPDEPFEIEIKAANKTATLIWYCGETMIAQARVTLSPHGD